MEIKCYSNSRAQSKLKMGNSSPMESPSPSSRSEILDPVNIKCGGTGAD